MSKFDTYSDIELDMLRQAYAAFPTGVDSPHNQDSAEYKAIVRLERDGLLEARAKWYEHGAGQKYAGLNITALGRIVLADVESNTAKWYAKALSTIRQKALSTIGKIVIAVAAGLVTTLIAGMLK